MQTIQLEINENYMGAFINIIENLKDEIVQSYKVLNKESLTNSTEQYLHSLEFLSDKEMFHQRFRDIKEGNAVLLSKDMYQKKIDGFVKELEVR